MDNKSEFFERFQYIYGHFQNLSFRVNFNLSLKTKRIIITKHCSIYKELQKWHRSNSLYLWHPEDDICSMKIEFLKTFSRRKDSKKKKKTKRNRVTRSFTKRYETETRLSSSVVRWSKGQYGKYLSREYRVANPGNLYRGNAILPIRDCYRYFVPRNRITRKVIVRLMISLTGTGIFVSLHFHDVQLQMWRNYSR